MPLGLLRLRRSASSLAIATSATSAHGRSPNSANAAKRPKASSRTPCLFIMKRTMMAVVADMGAFGSNGEKCPMAYRRCKPRNAASTCGLDSTNGLSRPYRSSSSLSNLAAFACTFHLFDGDLNRAAVSVRSVSSSSTSSLLVNRERGGGGALPSSAASTIRGCPSGPTSASPPAFPSSSRAAAISAASACASTLASAISRRSGARTDVTTSGDTRPTSRVRDE
mmetsp:Transcript_35269/g.80610  ORF Transcript_35269/g.80610 Transcript_35269/m.80610 type:complete len:224 (-) Transcript_35269:197-868(-)